jgi:hypothetical protein
MDLTVTFESAAFDAVRLFAVATNTGMYSGVNAQWATASVGVTDDGYPLLTLAGANVDSLLSLRRMLENEGCGLPSVLATMLRAREDVSLEAALHPRLRELVSCERLDEFSGDALFLCTQGAQASALYDVMRPVLEIWQQLLDRKGLPYQSDDDQLETEGIEIYERSAMEVEVATTGYGGGEDGVAALINGFGRQMQLAGLVFQIECWSG